MKVYFKKGICGLSGKKDDEVYYYNEALQQAIVRRYTKPKDSTETDRMKAVMANLKLISPSADYKQDFKDYTILYNKLRANSKKPDANWSNLYIKMLYALVKANPELDLRTLSRQQIYDENLPCKSVKGAIEEGLLPIVKDYARFVGLI